MTHTFQFMQAGVILAGVTIMALLSWYFIPEDHWLKPAHVKAILENTEQSAESTVTVDTHE